MRIARRQFLEHTIRLAALAGLSSAFPTFAAEKMSAYPFTLGVASGSPTHDSVVLWTRLLPDPFNPLPALAYKVRWEIAEDENFLRIAAKGEQAALAQLAHSVHIDVTGLQAGRWYWYRFMLGDAVSPVARTRTAPAPDQLASSLRLAVASCQHWEFGAYAAHQHIAALAPDLVAFLGDYIYEWGPYALAHPQQARGRAIESKDLHGYRKRYAQYKSDLQLQAAHHAAPWIVTWDDHEVCNDYANERDERLDADFLQRRSAAYQAFYEHMPVRLPLMPSSASASDYFSHMRIYERYDWGRLARFHVLDDRQYRSQHACATPGRGGASSVSHLACADLRATSRSMLGTQQEQWLAQGFASSGAKWNLLAQQTLMAQHSQSAIRQSDDGQFWTDGWDGYPAARQRLFDDLQKHRPLNPIVLSGDVHTFYAANLKRDFFTRASESNPVLATEFCGTSITSSSRPQLRTEQYLAQNPHIKFGRSDKRGFMLLDITPTQIINRFMALDDVANADSGISVLTSFVVEDGRAGVQHA